MSIVSKIFLICFLIVSGSIESSEAMPRRRENQPAPTPDPSRGKSRSRSRSRSKGGTARKSYTQEASLLVNTLPTDTDLIRMPPNPYGYPEDTASMHGIGYPSGMRTPSRHASDRDEIPASVMEPTQYLLETARREKIKFLEGGVRKVYPLGPIHILEGSLRVPFSPGFNNYLRGTISVEGRTEATFSPTTQAFAKGGVFVTALHVGEKQLEACTKEDYACRYDSTSQWQPGITATVGLKTVVNSSLAMVPSINITVPFSGDSGSDATLPGKKATVKVQFGFELDADQFILGPKKGRAYSVYGQAGTDVFLKR